MPLHFAHNFEKFQLANADRNVHLWTEDEVLDLLATMPRRVILAVSKVRRNRPAPMAYSRAPLV